MHAVRGAWGRGVESCMLTPTDLLRTMKVATCIGGQPRIPNTDTTICEQSRGKQGTVALNMNMTTFCVPVRGVVR